MNGANVTGDPAGYFHRYFLFAKDFEEKGPTLRRFQQTTFCWIERRPDHARFMRHENFIKLFSKAKRELESL